jgi:ribosomal protein S15P/S13E
MVKAKVEKKKLTQKEYEKKVFDLAKEGLTSEKIGQKLRNEGIHPSEYEGKISKILKESYVNPDLKNVEEKLEKIKAHYEKNNQDKKAKREKDRIFSQLRKLKKYFGIEVR